MEKNVVSLTHLTSHNFGISQLHWPFMGFIYHSIFPFYSFLAFPLFLPLFCSPIISLQVCESEKGKNSASRQPLCKKKKVSLFCRWWHFYHLTLTTLLLPSYFRYQRDEYLKILRSYLCCVTHASSCLTHDSNSLDSWLHITGSSTWVVGFC